MIRWRNPAKELPKQNEIVGVLMQHWKENGALSCEIFFGEVSWSNDKLSCVMDTMDNTGQGNTSYTIWKHEDYEYPSSYCDIARAWFPAIEFELPTWL